MTPYIHLQISLITLIKDAENFKSKFLTLHSVMDSTPFFHLHPIMRIDDTNGIYFDASWRKFARHPTANAFKFLQTPEKPKTFLISNTLSSEALKSHLQKEVGTESVKVGSCNKVMKVPYAKASFMKELLKPYKKQGEEMVLAIINGD